MDLGNLFKNKYSKEQTYYSRFCLVPFLTVFSLCLQASVREAAAAVHPHPCICVGHCMCSPAGAWLPNTFLMALRATACAMPQLNHNHYLLLGHYYLFEVLLQTYSCMYCEQLLVILHTCLVFCILPCSQSMLLIPGQGSSCKFHLHTILLVTHS